MKRFLSEKRESPRLSANEMALLQSLDQAKWGSVLPIDAATVDLVRYVRAVSEVRIPP